MNLSKNFNDVRVSKTPEEILTSIVRDVAACKKPAININCFVFLNEINGHKNSPYDQIMQLLQKVTETIKPHIVLTTKKDLFVLYKTFTKKPIVRYELEENKYSNGTCFTLSLYDEKRNLIEYRICFNLHNISYMSDSGLSSNDKEIVIFPDNHRNTNEKLIKILSSIKSYDHFKSIHANFDIFINASNMPFVTDEQTYANFIDIVKEGSIDLLEKVDSKYKEILNTLRNRVTVIDSENMYDDISKTFHYTKINKNIATVIIYHKYANPATTFRRFTEIDPDYKIWLRIPDDRNVVADRLLEYMGNVPTAEKNNMPSTETIYNLYDYDKLKKYQYRYDYILMSMDQFISYYTHLLNLSDPSSKGFPNPQLDSFDLINLVLLDGIDETAFERESKNACDKLKIYKFNEVKK